MAKTIVKEEILKWLKDIQEMADPPTAIVFENVISTIESGAFDNSKFKIKVRSPCEYLKRTVMFIPDEDDENTGEFIAYHNCILCARDIPCAYPARHCEYKVEFDEFAEYILEAAKNTNETD